MSNTLGSALKEARRKSGLTQMQVAEALFVTRQTISNWENGRSEPDLEMLKRLAELLGWDLDEAFGQEKKEIPEEKQDIVENAPVEVVQPQPENYRRRWVMYLSAALLCLLLVLGVVALAQDRQPDYTPEWFKQSVSRMEEQAWVDMYVRPNNAPEDNMVEDDIRIWHYALILREEGGVGAQLEKLSVVYFFENGTHQTAEYSRDILAEKWQRSHLDKYGLLRYVMYHKHDMQLQLKGVGIHVIATDDKSNALEFRCYFDADEL